MKSLPVLMIGIVLSATAGAASASDAPAIDTVTVTAKHPRAGLATGDKTPLETRVEIATPLPTDMPEAEIDLHMTPIAAWAPVYPRTAP